MSRHRITHYAFGGTNFGGGILVKTTDGGTTWSNQKTEYELRSVCFTDVKTGYIVGMNGTILKTTTAGEAGSK